MSFQAYLDNIKAKTGKSADDFKKLAEKKGLLKAGVKAGEIVSWLKEEYSLGHGHAMAIYAVLKSAGKPKESKDEAVEKHFSGSSDIWHKAYSELMLEIGKWGSDVSVSPTSTYLSLLRGKKKFGIIQVSKERMDIGVKLKNSAPVGKFEPAGSWNNMMTHRVKIGSLKEIDKNVMQSLKKAYEECSTVKK